MCMPCRLLPPRIGRLQHQIMPSASVHAPQGPDPFDYSVSEFFAARAVDGSSVLVRDAGMPGKGRGLFAARAFAAGEDVGVFSGRLVHKHLRIARDLVRDTLTSSKSESAPREENHFLDLDATVRIAGLGRIAVVIVPGAGDLMRFCNHSCLPNCAMRVHPGNGVPVLRAEEDIAAGEEITWDYMAITNRKEEEVACLCGSPACRSFFVEHRPSLDNNRASTFAYYLRVALRATVEALDRDDLAVLVERGFDGPMYASLPQWAAKWAALVLRLLTPMCSQEGLLRACLARIDFVQRAVMDSPGFRLPPPFEVLPPPPKADSGVWRLSRNPPPSVVIRDVYGGTDYKIHSRAIGASMVYFTNSVQRTPEASFSRDCHAFCDIHEKLPDGSWFYVPADQEPPPLA